MKNKKKEVICKGCNGEGVVWKLVLCPKCKGHGMRDKRKKAIKLAKTGTIVQYLSD
jgi:DnaJ-class molecular chaperone